MRKIYYYILITLIACLLMGFSVNAAQTATSASRTMNGITYTVSTYSNTGITATNQEFYEQNNYEYMTNSYEISYPIILTGGTQGHYLNGYANIRINKSQTNTNITMSSSTLSFTNTESLKVFMGGSTQSSTFLYVFFDNFYVSGSAMGLGVIEEIYTQNRINPDQTTTNADFNNTILWQSGNIQSTNYPLDNGLSHIISNSVGYAISTATEFDDIVTMLTTIRSADAAFYVSLTNQLTNLLTAQNLTNTNLTAILNELDLDFSAVQTVLDLFPTYRTLVLQYWQQLLEMNAQQSSEAAEMESQYQDKDQQSGDLLSGLGSLTLPSVSSGDFNILANTDDTAKTNFFGLIGTITNNTFITNMLLIIITAAIVGYALYGKK